MAAAELRERPSPAGRASAPELEPADDREDVPAAVVCALCGQAECAGCDAAMTHSGLVAFVPWERPFAPWPMRLWQTARLASREPERFFESLPDGSVMAALRFAAVTELLSGLALLIAALPFAALVAPGYLAHLTLDPEGRAAALRVIAASVPALAALMVAAHAAHGLALARSARRVGARPRYRQALRFGLYACGWDITLGPIGFVVTWVLEGAAAAAGLVGVGVSLPSRSARAFVRGAYRVDGAGARPILAAGTRAAVVVTLVGAVCVLAWLAALALG